MTAEITIAYEDVYKRFDAPVLSGVSLSVMRGETISILGTSGTGTRLASIHSPSMS